MGQECVRQGLEKETNREIICENLDGLSGLTIVMKECQNHAERWIYMTQNQIIPLVSVIIPCYNCEKYVEETLISLEKQTYQNYEVICVNDGSVDNTETILQQWAEKKKNIRVINQENGGVSRARNHGMKEAKAEYILFLDSDDLYAPGFIQTMVEQCEAHDAQTVYCGLTRDLAKLETVDTEMVTQVQHQEMAMTKMMMDISRFGFYCYLYKKSIIEAFDLHYDESTRYGEDREFLWKYLCHCQKAVFIDRNLYGYRVNMDSVTQKKATWEQTVQMDVLDRVSAHFEQYHCSFFETFRQYMYPRTAWSIARIYSMQHSHDLFRKLTTVYDMKRYMVATAKNQNRLVALSSVLYLVHKDLFYYALSLGARVREHL